MCSPEDEALEDLVGDAEACVPENQPQVEAGGLARVVPVILQERGLGRAQSVLYLSFKETVGCWLENRAGNERSRSFQPTIISP